jgi:hypothetical protein
VPQCKYEKKKHCPLSMASTFLPHQQTTKTDSSECSKQATTTKLYHHTQLPQNQQVWL